MLLLKEVTELGGCSPRSSTQLLVRTVTGRAHSTAVAGRLTPAPRIGLEAARVCTFPRSERSFRSLKPLWPAALALPGAAVRGGPGGNGDGPRRPAHPRPKMAAAPHAASRPRGPSRAARGARPPAEPPPRASAAGSRSPPPAPAALRPAPSPPPCRDRPRAVRGAAGRGAVRRGGGGGEGRRAEGGGLRAPWCTATRARLRVWAVAGGSGGRKRRERLARAGARGRAGPDRAGSRHAPGQHGLPDPAGGAAGAHHLPQPRGTGLRGEPAPAAAAAGRGARRGPALSAAGTGGGGGGRGVPAGRRRAARQLHAHLRDRELQHGRVPAARRRLHPAARPPGDERHAEGAVRHAAHRLHGRAARRRRPAAAARPGAVPARPAALPAALHARLAALPALAAHRQPAPDRRGGGPRRLPRHPGAALRPRARPGLPLLPPAGGAAGRRRARAAEGGVAAGDRAGRRLLVRGRAVPGAPRLPLRRRPPRAGPRDRRERRGAPGREGRRTSARGAPPGPARPVRPREDGAPGRGSALRRDRVAPAGGKAAGTGCSEGRAPRTARGNKVTVYLFLVADVR